MHQQLSHFTYSAEYLDLRTTDNPKQVGPHAITKSVRRIRLQLDGEAPFSLTFFTFTNALVACLYFKK